MSPDASNKRNKKGIKGVIAGAITGSIEIRITFPIEYVKIQLQLDGEGQTKKFNGMLDVVWHTIKRHGFFGLYRGIELMLYTSPVKSAIRFGVFEQSKQYLLNEKGKLTPTRKMICGLAAGTVEGTAIVTPTENFKVKLINDSCLEKPKCKGLLHGVQTIYKEFGMRGLYKGVTPTVARQGMNQAVRFYMMETQKEFYTGGDTSKSIPKYMIATFGAFSATQRAKNGIYITPMTTTIGSSITANKILPSDWFALDSCSDTNVVQSEDRTPKPMSIGACSCFATAPIDVVKTRMQSLYSFKYNNSLDCFKKIWRREGFYSFYKGAVPRLCRNMMDVAISFTIYDIITELLDYIGMMYTC